MGRGIVYLIAAAGIYSFLPILIRGLNAGHLPPISQVFLRYIFAFLAAVVYFAFSRSEFNVKKKDILLLFLVAVFGYGATNLLFTYGVLLTQVSTALFIFYGFGILTPIFAIFFLKEKVNAWNLAALALGVVSLLLLFRPTSFITWKLGAIFALGAALAQSFYLVGRKKLAVYSSKLILLFSTFLGTLSVGTLALILEKEFYFGGGLSLISSLTWLTTVLFGFMNFAAWYLMSKGFQGVKATTGGLVLLLENFFAVTVAYFFFAEIPTVYAFLGGILIILSSVLVIIKGESN